MSNLHYMGVEYTICDDCDYDVDYCKCGVDDDE